MPLDTGFPIAGHSVVGQPIDRRDGRLKVSGRARYAAEFDIGNLAHAVLVQSTIASGEIIGMDLAAAQAAPGVLAILTPDNAPRLPEQPSGQSETSGPLVAKPVLQDKLVYYSTSPWWSPTRWNGRSTPPRWSRSSTANTRRRSGWRTRSAPPIRRSASVTASVRRTAGAATRRRRWPPRRCASTRPIPRRSSTTIRWSRMRRSRCGRATATTGA